MSPWLNTPRDKLQNSGRETETGQVTDGKPPLETNLIISGECQSPSLHKATISAHALEAVLNPLTSEGRASDGALAWFKHIETTKKITSIEHPTRHTY